MKLLVVSHPCVTPVNQEFFAEVERQSGWNLTLLAPSNWIDEYGARKGLQRGSSFRGRLIAFPVWPPGNIPLHVYLRWIPSLLKSERPDAIFVHHEPYAAATAQIYLANHYSINVPIGFFTWQNINKKYPPPFRQLEQFVYRKSAFACPGSGSALEVLRNKGYSGSHAFMPASLNTNIYYPRSNGKLDSGNVASSEDEVLIGFVGRIAEEKGLRTLLKALAAIEELNWRLIVVGTGSFDAEFDRLAEDLRLSDRVDRTGYVDHAETPEYLSAFDVLVLPSETQPNWKEQFGRVIIEALACGTPVIGSDSGEIPHLVRRTGGGLVFPEGEHAELADRLRSFIINATLRNETAKRGLEYVRSNYVDDKIASRFIALTQDAVDNS